MGSLRVKSSEYCEVIAGRIRDQAEALSKHWLVRLNELVPVPPNEVFPTEAILDHIPTVIREIGAYLRSPDDEEIGSNAVVLDKARELGVLRYGQKASIHQLLREYEVLGVILQRFVSDETLRLGLGPEASDALALASRLSRAVHVLLRTTVDTFTAEYADTIARQTTQLEGFNRMVSHELRNPLGTLGYAVSLLRRDEIASDPGRRGKIVDMVARNFERMRDLLQKLEQLSHLEKEASDLPTLQRVELDALAAEVARQLAEVAEKRGVEIRIAGKLPVVVVDPARVELVLMNLVSNGIKYRDPDKAERWVEVGAGEGDSIVLWVRDNGLGIPSGASASLFTRFFRAHPERDAELGNEGSGLGLSIVHECVEALGGRIRVESDEGQGTTFFVDLPIASADEGEQGAEG